MKNTLNTPTHTYTHSAQSELSSAKTINSEEVEILIALIKLRSTNGYVIVKEIEKKARSFSALG